MAEVFSESGKSKERDDNNNRPPDPFGDGTVSRVGWQDGPATPARRQQNWQDGPVAPLARNLPQVDTSMTGADPNYNDPKRPWRAGQSTAPITERIVPVDPTLDGPDPNRNDPKKPWRAGQEAAPSAQRLEPVSPTLDTDINRPGGRASYPGSVYRGPDAGSVMPAAGDDWKQRAEEQMRREGPPKGFPVPGAPGQQNGVDNVDVAKRRAIDNSLDLATPYFDYLGTAGLSGAGSAGLVWGLDKKLSLIPASERSGLWKVWEARSPMMKEHAEFMRRINIASDAVSSSQTALNLANRKLVPHADAFTSMVSAIDGKIEAGIADEAAMNMAKRQQAFFADTTGANLSPSKLVGALGSETEVRAGTKLFTVDSEEGKIIQRYAVARQEAAKAQGTLASSEATLKSAQDKFTQATKDGPGPLKGALLDGAARGALYAGGALALGYGVDSLLSKYTGFEPKTDAMTRFAIDGIAVPSILLAGGESRFKWAAAGGLFLSARAYEIMQGTGMAQGSVQMSRLLRPNSVDAVLIPAAATIPMLPAALNNALEKFQIPGLGTGWQGKAAQIGIAYALGRGYNLLAHEYNWDGSKDSGREWAEQLSQSFNRDRLVHTEDSFMKAVKDAKELGNANEARLELEYRDWQAKDTGAPGTEMKQMRGNAILTAALGEFRLESGSRLSVAGHMKGITAAEHADTEDRILKGYNFDFAGEATTWLRNSARDIIRMRNYCRTHDGETVDGVVMNADYDKQLEKLQKHVEAQLDKIYGEHDVDGVYNELLVKSRKQVFKMDQALVKLVEEYPTIKTSDTRFLAKKARDIAIGYLAEAERSNNSNYGTGADANGKMAWEFLQRAEQLDPNNKDLPKIKAIAGRVIKGIQPAIDSQNRSTINNPFELKPSDIR